MIKKIIGGGIGAKLAERTPKVGRATGAFLGAAAPALIRRLSFPALIATAAGGFFAKKYYDDRQKADPTNDGIAGSAN